MMNLEIEYKNLIDSELPDLWSRIEAGVDAYEASKKNNDNIQTIKTSDVDEKTITETSEESKLDEKLVLIRKAKRKQTIMTIGKIVAAAAVLFIVVNGVRMFNGPKNMATNNDVAMADGSYATAESAAEAPAAADDSYDNSIMADAEMATEARVEEEADDAVSEASKGETMAPETDAKNSATQAYSYDDSNRGKQGIKADEKDSVMESELVDYISIYQLREIMPGLELSTLVDISKSLYELEAGNIVEVSEATEVSDQEKTVLPDEVKNGVGNNEKLIHETLTDDKGITYDLYMAESDEMRFVALYKVEKTE